LASKEVEAKERHNVEVRGSRSEAEGTKSVAFGCSARLQC
jgi:hypothetical protein